MGNKVANYGKSVRGVKSQEEGCTTQSHRHRHLPLLMVSRGWDAWLALWLGSARCGAALATADTMRESTHASSAE